jgi:hypothetical protein
MGVGFIMFTIGNIWWAGQQLIHDKTLKTQSKIVELEYEKLLKGERIDYARYRKR